MQTIEQALKDICQLHERLVKAPAPEIGPQAFLPFPPGIDPVAYAIEEVSQLQKFFESQSATPVAPTAAWVPRVDIHACDAEVFATVEIPGVAKENVSVTFAGGELIVRGQRDSVSPEGDLKPVFLELPWGTFERRLPVPSWCNPEKITARYTHGVLEIRISRGEEGTSTEFRVEIS